MIISSHVNSKYRLSLTLDFCIQVLKIYTVQLFFTCSSHTRVILCVHRVHGLSSYYFKTVNKVKCLPTSPNIGFPPGNS